MDQLEKIADRLEDRLKDMEYWGDHSEFIWFDKDEVIFLIDLLSKQKNNEKGR